MEQIAFINQSFIGLMQLSGLFLIAYFILLWMMFRGVSNAYIYGANTFGNDKLMNKKAQTIYNQLKEQNPNVNFNIFES